MSDKDERLKLLGGLIVILVVSIVGLSVISPAWYQNYSPKQPIPFSHKKHAGKFEIPCEYCHVRNINARYMEVPGLGVCMNCHQAVKTDSPWIQKITKAYKENKPIAWKKVYAVADYVRFNHGRHLEAGLECATCHGAVETMEQVYQVARLTMGWCVDCHRNNDYVTPYREEFSQVRRELQGNPEKSFVSKLLSRPDPHNADMSCSTCHY